LEFINASRASKGYQSLPRAVVGKSECLGWIGCIYLYFAGGLYLAVFTCIPPVFGCTAAKNTGAVQVRYRCAAVQCGMWNFGPSRGSHPIKNAQLFTEGHEGSEEEADTVPVDVVVGWRSLAWLGFSWQLG